MKNFNIIETIKTKGIQSLALLLAVSTLTLTACNTVEGAGEDIESMGDSISDTADN